MVYEGLAQRMDSESVSAREIAEAVGVPEKTVEKWLDGSVEIDTCEALVIQRKCFPNASLEELFAKTRSA